MEIIYAFIGKLPSYILGTVHQVRTWSNNKITLITDDIESPYINLLKNYNVSVINAKELEDTSFLNTVDENINKFCIATKIGDRKLLFIKSFERFFLLLNYMKKYNPQHILFLELDMLLYFNPDDLLPKLSEKEMALSYVDKDFYCSAFFYIKSVEILTNLTNFFKQFIKDAKPDEFLSEMLALGKWFQNPQNLKSCWLLPSAPNHDSYNILARRDFHAFNKSLFDGLGIAIAVDGPDYTHRNEWKQKEKKWWATDVKYYQYSYNWKTVNGLRVLYAKPDAPGAEEYKVQCLHVHRKYIHGFLSQPMMFGGDPSDYKFIHGDRFLKMAEVVLRKKSRTDYYKVEGWDQKNCLFFEDIPNFPEVFNNPKMIFMNTEDVEEFMNHLYKLKNPFILITHNSDTNVTQRFLPLCDHEKLIHWFTQNLCIEHPLISPLPIGFANPIWQHGNYSLFSHVKQMDHQKTLPYYANFLIETNRQAREQCLSVLNKKQIPIFQRSPPHQYILELANSLFCICPEGNGIDTHRFWEALYLGTVPIVLRNTLTERFSKDFPCVLLDKWEDLPDDPVRDEKMQNCLSWIESNNPPFLHKIEFAYYSSQILSAYLNS